MARKQMKSTLGKGLLAVESSNAPRKVNATFSLPVIILDKLEDIVYHIRSEKEHNDKRKVNKSSILAELIEERHKTIKQ